MICLINQHSLTPFDQPITCTSTIVNHSTGAANSPGNIHFRIYDDVTDIASWTFKEKSVFATLLQRYYSVSFHLCHETTRYL